MLLTKLYLRPSLLLFSFLFLQNSMEAVNDMQLTLKLMPDGCWGVFVMPTGSGPISETITGSGQVTLILPIGFEWGNLTSEGGLWSATGGTVAGPPEAPNSQYVSFGLISAEPVHPIILEHGVETLLFTFCAVGNSVGECPEFMSLLECGGNTTMPDPFCPPNSSASNPGNDLSVIEFSTPITYHNFGGNYGTSSWSCNDCDADGIVDAEEDTNGNGIFDPGIDSSDFCNACDPLYPELIGHLELVGGNTVFCANSTDSVYLKIGLTDLSGNPMSNGYGPLTIQLNDSDGLYFSSSNYFIGDSIIVPYNTDTAIYQLASIIIGQSCEADLDASNNFIQVPIDGPLNILQQPNDITSCQGDGYYFFASASNTFGNELNYNWQCSIDGIIWVNLENISPYEGVYSDTLFITDFNGLTGNHYRLAVHSTYCDTVFSDDAILAYGGWLFEYFDTLQICANDSVLIFGNYENVPGNYTDTVISLIGCDTIFNYFLNVFNVEEIFDTLQLCAGDSVLIFGNYESEAGSYSGLLPGIIGCDTILNIELEINELEEISQTINICPGDSVFIFGNYENVAGSYTGILPGSIGCNTILNIELGINDLVEVYETKYICIGDTAFIFGNYETETGEYTGIIPGLVGCDTVLTIALELTPPIFLFNTISICEGDSVLIHGNYETEPGDYEVVLPGIFGCDTTSLIILEIFPLPVQNQLMSICEGDSVLLFGNYESEAGIYSGTIPSVSGCDTILNVTLEINSLIESFEIIKICKYDSVFIFGNYESETGLYTGIVEGITGCDTLLSISLIKQTIVFLTTEEITICHGDSALIFGNYETTQGYYYYDDNNSVGCDTLWSIRLIVNPGTVVHETITICEGDSVLIFGNYETEPGKYVQYIDSLECGYEERYLLKYSAPIELNIVTENSCQDEGTGIATVFAGYGVKPFTYEWSNNGIEPTLSYLAPGDYSVTVTDALGCTASISSTVGIIPPIPYNVEIKDANCVGEDGSISFTDFPIGTQFSLDGQSFTDDPDFSGLLNDTYDLVLLSPDGCRLEESLVVQQGLGFQLFLPDDLTIQLGDSIQLISQVNTSSPMTYVWSPADFLDCWDCPRPWASPLETTHFALTAIDENDCVETEGITIYVNKKGQVYVPNAFSPNGDGINDVLMVFAGSNIRQVKQFLIFDRWGETVWRQEDFPVNNPNYGWDGAFRGNPMGAGVFAWIAIVERVDGQEEMLKGEVQLMK